MLEIVVENTNKYSDTLSVNYSDHDKNKVRRAALSEIKAFIGKAVNNSTFCFRKEITMVSHMPKKGNIAGSNNAQ
jgi:hypothetical protein